MNPPEPLRRAVGRIRGDGADLRERIEALEGDVEELRRHNLRLAEIVDVVQELLVPLASRDQERVDAAIEKFSRSL